MSMSNKRKAAWRFTAVWTFPGNMVATISTDPIVSQNEVRQMETEMKRLVLQAQRFPPHLRNIELRYKLFDWELDGTKIPIQLPVQGYIQSQNNYSIDFHNLNQWFNANWSPVENQLRRDATYLAWVEDDPAYRHVQVNGANGFRSLICVEFSNSQWSSRKLTKYCSAPAHPVFLARTT